MVTHISWPSVCQSAPATRMRQHLMCANEKLNVAGLAWPELGALLAHLQLRQPILAVSPFYTPVVDHYQLHYVALAASQSQRRGLRQAAVLCAKKLHAIYLRPLTQTHTHTLEAHTCAKNISQLI